MASDNGVASMASGYGVASVTIYAQVNASTRDRRDKLRDLFSPGTDLKRDKGRMDAYLKGGALETVDVQRQKRLLASFAQAREVEVDAALIAQLRAIIGDAPTDYCARLLRDAAMKMDGAVDVHFGANQGAVPREYYATKNAGPTEDDDRDLLVGAVFAVRGRDEDFKLFKGSTEPPPKRARGAPRPKAQQPGGAADKIRARLTQLGACVVERDARGAKKLASTHVIVPEGTETGQLIGLDVLVRVRTESWLIKRCRALDAGTVAPPPPEVVESAKKQAQGPPKEKIVDKGPRGETRAGVRRRRTRETDTNAQRALSETMYLVERRDEVRHFTSGACRAPPLRHVFAVLGSTGNVYDVAIQKEPSCSCPYAVSHPTKVCKHRYFVWYRVLKIPRDDDAHCSEADAKLKHVPHQRYLRIDELQTVLVDHAASAAPMASRAARDAYRRASGDGVIDVDADSDREVLEVDTEAQRRPLDECTVCFEAFGDAAHDFCGQCGRNYHAACRDRWFAHKKARVCAVCAAPWRAAPVAPGASVAQEEGYVNLRAFQPDVANERDVSSYAQNDRGERWADVHADRAAAAAPPPPPPSAS